MAKQQSKTARQSDPLVTRKVAAFSGRSNAAGIDLNDPDLPPGLAAMTGGARATVQPPTKAGDSETNRG
jgi:hypothetical protein